MNRTDVVAALCLDAVVIEKKLAITEAVGAVEKERDELKSGLQRVELEKHLAEKSLKEKYETQIKDRALLALWPLQPLGIGQRALTVHHQCGVHQGLIDAGRLTAPSLR